MQALLTTAPRHMEVQEVAEPGEPGPGEVLLRIEAAGICGSDYSLYLGKHPYSRFPSIQGHEFCGSVVAFGADTKRRIREGTRVAVEPLLPCGHCYPCREGRYNCCTNLKLIGVHLPGAFQPYLCVPEHLLNAADDLPADLAAFAEPVTIALQAVKRAAVRPGDSVLILGAGPIGQALVLSSLSNGARVAVSDLVESRLERASQIGAETVVHPGQDLEAAMRSWTDGQGPTVVIDATGAPSAIRSAFEVVAAAGRIVIVGISDRDVSVPVISYSRKELTVLGSRNSVHMFPEALALVRGNQNEIRSIISHRISLAEAPEMIETALARPEIVEKAVIMF